MIGVSIGEGLEPHATKATTDGLCRRLGSALSDTFRLSMCEATLFSIDGELNVTG